jgi:tyrosine-protein kinase Etk/Wzc
MTDTVNLNSNDVAESDEISLFELATTIGEEKKLVFGLPLVAGVVAIVVSLLLTPIYTAKTTLIPPQSNSGGAAAAALASLGGLAGLAGVSASGSSAETYISMLNSRSARDAMIDQFNLLERYEVDLRADAYKILESNVSVTSDPKSGLVTLEVKDEDPEFAAQLANAYYETLRVLLNRVAVTEAQQRRVFFEDQFAKTKEELSAAEVKLKETSERTGLVELQAQAEVSIEAVAQLRAQIAQREVQLSALRTFATTENTEYLRVAAELSGLKRELAKLEKSGGSSVSSLISTGNLPEQGLEYVRALREVKYQEAIFEIMAKQFELAKVDESKEGTSIQQLDMAVPPERRSSPKRGLIVIASILAAGVLAVLIALFKGALRKSRHNPESAKQLQQLRSAWSLSRK